jgi:hypothetical protein
MSKDPFASRETRRWLSVPLAIAWVGLGACGDAETLRGAPSSSDTSSSDDASARDDRAKPGDGGLLAPNDGAVPECAAIAGVPYDRLAIAGPPSDRPAALHGDINLRLRKLRSHPTATRGLISINGPTDPGAPRLTGLFAVARPAAIADVFQAETWDWGCNCAKGWMGDMTDYVQVIALATTAGEVIYAPASGYDIGQGHAALVLYAGADTLTLEYTRADSVATGYAIHLAGVCVEPSLAKSYLAANAAGRAELPAVRPRQALGRALSGTVLVAVRDTGAWMDPRSQKDWW